MNIGKSIKIALLHKGCTQKQLSKMLRVHISTVVRLANGRSCSMDRVNQLAEVFEMKVSDFIALGESEGVG